MSRRSGFVIASVVVLSAALASAALAQRPAVTVVTGTVVGADGAPMKLAHAHLQRPITAGRIARAQVTPDGRFAIATTETGGFRLLFTGVDHYSTSVPLLITSPTTIALDVRLKHHTYIDSLDRVRAIGDFNNFKADSGRPLVRQPDGRYTLEVETSADTLAYQLVGLDTVANGTRTTGGTLADRYSYVDNAGYRSVIRARNRRATIVFDPSALQRPAAAPSVTFRDTTTQMARCYSLIRDLQERSQALFDSSGAARVRRDSTLRYDWAPFVARRMAALQRERDPIVRQLLLFQFFGIASMSGRLDSALGWRIAREIPPTSPWWAFPEVGPPSAMMLAFRAGLGRTETPRAGTPPDTVLNRLMLGYLDRIVAEHPDSVVRGEALASAIGWAEGSRRNEYYLRFARDYPNSPSASYLNAAFAPGRIWQVGRRVPTFRLASLDDTAATYTPESLAGKPYLLEFWATWCGPCIVEMADLHQAHDSLAADSVEFISVSLDARSEDVRTFRNGEWRMPWRHAIAPGGFSNPQMRQLEIMFVPRAILVGRDGTILAVDGDLRGRSLLPTIRRALRASPSP